MSIEQINLYPRPSVTEALTKMVECIEDEGEGGVVQSSEDGETLGCLVDGECDDREEMAEAYLRACYALNREPVVVATDDLDEPA